MNTYVILPSNIISQDQTFINKTSHFKALIPKELNLNSEWEVALVEVIIPYTWYNTGVNWISYKKEDNVITKNIKGGYYKTALDLCNLIMETIPSWFEGNVYFDKIRQKGVIELGENEGVSMSDELAKLLGFSKTKYNNITINTDNTTYQNKKIISPNISSTNEREHLIYIYTNIIKNTLLGDQFAPILKVISVEGEYGKNIYQEFQRPMYIPLKIDQIQWIEISLRRDDGLLVPFETGKSVLTLHFRKIK
jgi:hypothetical protein